MKTFFEWIEQLYRERFTGKVELDFLNGVPRSWARAGPRESFKVDSFDKPDKSRDALTV